MSPYHGSSRAHGLGEEDKNYLCNVLFIILRASKVGQRSTAELAVNYAVEVPEAMSPQPGLASPIPYAEEISKIKHPHLLRTDIKHFPS